MTTVDPTADLLSNTDAVSALASALTGTSDPAAVEEKLRTSLGAFATIFANLAPNVPPSPGASAVTTQPKQDDCVVDGFGKVTYPETPPFGYVENQLPGIIAGTSVLPPFLEKTGDPIGEALAKFFAFAGGIVTLLGAVSPIYWRSWINNFNNDYPTMPTPPAELADQVVRNVVDLKTATTEAQISGVDPNRFFNMYMNTGEPPGVMEELSLWRRGLIDTPWMHRVLSYSRIRPEYFCDILNLAHQPMSAADAVNGYIKQTPVTEQDFADAGWKAPADKASWNNDFFQRAFVRAGGLSYEWDLLKTMAGDSLGTMQVLNLWNHHAETGVTEADVDQVLARSRINPIFFPLAKKLRMRWLSPFQVHQAVNAGSVTPETAQRWLEEDGYSPEQAKAFSTASTKKATAKAKEETESQLVELFRAGIIGTKEFYPGMRELGYSDDETNYIVEVADAQKVLAAQNNLITRTRTAYFARRIDIDTVKRNLGLAGVGTAAVNQIAADWPAELGTVYKELTAAQIGDLVKKGMMGWEQATTRWERLGYDSEDTLYLWTHYLGGIDKAHPIPTPH